MDILSELSPYSQWEAAIFMVVLSSIFIFSFIPLRKRNWKALGITEAFIIALYTEMYGLPLTIYLLTSVLGMKIPLAHTAGHLWSTIFGFGETGAIIEMLIGNLITIFGVALIIAGWKRIYRAKAEGLVTDGVYAYVRHPQYSGIILAAFGTFIHWPTLPTLLMLPILIVAYYKLAKREEKGMEAKFGAVYQEYKKEVPMFLPSFASAPRSRVEMKAKTVEEPPTPVDGPPPFIRGVKNEDQTRYECPECGFLYKEKKWKDQCEAWCKKYKSCNLEITKHAVQP